MNGQPQPSPSRIPTALRSGLASYAGKVAALSGTQLECLAVFGTALTPDWRPAQHQDLMRTSLDTFPLEWLEIGGCHEVLAGADPFAGLRFAAEHVRLQCERESTVLAIALRQRLLRAAGAGESLELPAEQVVRILRGLLHLAGGELPAAPGALLAAAAERLGLDVQPVVRARAGARGVDAITDLHRTVAAMIARSDRA